MEFEYGIHKVQAAGIHQGLSMDRHGRRLNVKEAFGIQLAYIGAAVDRNKSSIGLPHNEESSIRGHSYERYFTCRLNRRWGERLRACNFRLKPLNGMRFVLHLIVQFFDVV